MLSNPSASPLPGGIPEHLDTLVPAISRQNALIAELFSLTRPISAEAALRVSELAVEIQAMGTEISGLTRQSGKALADVGAGLEAVLALDKCRADAARRQHGLSPMLKRLRDQLAGVQQTVRRMA